ncbi:tetratricopeptide repeat protein [Cellulophaga baltica]|uniref:tetratricopeptide repeat-containing sensor histidine kinase n=1 Tax=Cellulophaga TaxID=104264 RepID=UPI001C079108|nr:MULTISPECIES: HAMP domain-containing sensor histidine kinase [Cellulophaga]MBU2995275.1 tetratricopeptide repeat protein [Cellulophaga baltica]MDO6766670.1 ATP-binding protein [Cellulophaga sp. 1_MG-2023]
MKHLKRICYSIFSFVICLLSFDNLKAQNTEKDSLKHKIEQFKLKPNFQKDTTYINMLYRYGKDFGYYNLDSLLLISNEAFKLSKAINYTKGESQSLIILGNYYSDNNKEKAMELYAQALTKAKKVNNIKLILRAKSSLAIGYTHKENFTEALKQYYKSIEIAKKNNENAWLSSLYISITVIYSIQKEYKDCIYFLKKSMEINKKTGNERMTAITLTNLTSTYLNDNNVEKADETIDEAIQILEKLQLDDWLTFAYELKGNIYLAKEDFKKALTWFQKSELKYGDIDIERYQIPLYNGIAKAHLGVKQYGKAEKSALKALALSKKFESLDQRDDILKTLYLIKKQTNKPTKALEYLEGLKNISDTINKNNNKKELQILKSKYAFDQEKERYLLENEKKIAQQKNYFYVAIIIIIAFFMIIIILKKNNKIKENLNKKLTHKTEELKKNETFLKNANDTKSKLFSIIAHDLKGPINSFKSIFELLELGKINTEEFMSLAPKLGENMNGISFTLNNLLTWGQTQVNGIVTNLENIDLNTIASQNKNLLSKTAEQKQITVTNDIPTSAFAIADRNQISIVIRNLVSNALKFTPKEGNITIGANELNDTWEIYIRDTGIGLSDEALTKIFNTNETFTTYGTNNEKGTGLGLLLCKEMVENNRGEIRVESSLNNGTSFYFTLPKW